MFDSIGNKIGNVYKQAYSKVMPPKTESEFLTKGTLTPAEYLVAGDQLTKACPSWQWKPALDSTLARTEFPHEKQYLQTTVQSAMRVKDMFQNIGSKEQHIDDEWVNLQQEQDHKQDEPQNKKDEEMEQKQEDDELIAGFVQMDVDDETNVKTRLYTISMVYDYFYCTPRVFISGVDLENQVLSQEDIFQDVMSDYAHKTVTFETMPCLNTKQANIHPCKHSEALLKIISVMRGNGMEVHPHMVLFIFLKFINSIMPTLDFDSTLDVYIA